MLRHRGIENGIFLLLVQVVSWGSQRELVGCQSCEQSDTFTFSVTQADLHQGQNIRKGSKGERSYPRILVQYNPTDSHPHRRPGPQSSPAVLEFPRALSGLGRRKREWVVPPISVSENSRGPYPFMLVQIQSSHGKREKILYSISGPGADQPPVGIFTISRTSGWLAVTQSLDREETAQYRLLATAEAEGNSGPVEQPMELIINVIDQNDNKPVFTQGHYQGSVLEGSAKGLEFMKVTATDADEPGNANADVRYRVLSQRPAEPRNAFFINPVTGGLQVNSTQLDREKQAQYDLVIQAADLEGEGMQSSCSVTVKILDRNDHAPKFLNTSYTGSVPENTVGAEILRMTVSDEDEVHSPNWASRYTIISGNEGGVFNVSTGSDGLQGILTTAKGLDFEQSRQWSLLVVVENEVPFAVPLLTSTATVTVIVKDLNEPPVFLPEEKVISKSEDLPVDSVLTHYTATDPDTAMNQTISYKVLSDLGGWLTIDEVEGRVSLRSPMDRESPFITEGKYKAVIQAIDHDASPDSRQPPATGTGTLIIEVEDVNDNGPSVQQTHVTLCNHNPPPVLLSVSDPDGPGFSSPFRVELPQPLRNHWTVRMNETKTGIILSMKTALRQGDYELVLRVSDSGGFSQDNTLRAEVCDCTGSDISCSDVRVAGFALPAILGIVGAILFLILLLLLVLLTRRRSSVTKEALLQEEEVRDDIYCYNEEGGGEEDQDFDISQLHRVLDKRACVYRDDVIPTFPVTPAYRPLPANPEDIGNFIEENLNAADRDPSAPPYDSLLVFDYEGAGSEVGSLSSLQSGSSDGNQDYHYLNQWGAPFRKLADMYGGGEED
ncbi:B-cadherin isoform X2 [Chanos chanos]|uniref:Cadherin-1 n=1 Tax=Chanos chanos TaxID=29144 RepID=A0A6J2WMG5_CHACN|nr:B-cadherin-like isoform X2 [Chanos chanos]